MFRTHAPSRRLSHIFHRNICPCRSASTLPFPSHHNPTPYDIFHLSPASTQADVRKRYLELARIHHPDCSTCDDPKVAAERFKAIQVAHDTLKDPFKRADYDRRSRLGQASSLYSDPWDEMRRQNPYSTGSKTRMAHERTRRHPSTAYDFPDTHGFSDLNSAPVEQDDHPQKKHIIFAILSLVLCFYVWQLNHIFQGNSPARLILRKILPLIGSSDNMRESHDRRHVQAAKSLEDAKQNAFMWENDHRHEHRLSTSRKERTNTGGEP